MRKLYGGRLCLDFANTLEPRAAEPVHDWLGGYADLVTWARHAGALDQATTERLLASAATRPAEAEASFAAAIELREAIYRVFAAIAEDAAPAATDLDRLQQAYAEAMRHTRLLPTAGPDRLAWSFDGGDALDRAWWPMARSAVELATAGRLERIKRCRPGCGFLFFDASKNRIRRWCSMEECGGQTKARRQTARRRAARARAAG
jgi:predicted RNA-binding Zn ribbon-like protein